MMKNEKEKSNIIEIIDYAARRYSTGVELENVEKIDVIVISGDELLDITLNNGDIVKFDAETLSNNFRLIDFFDGTYTVMNYQLAKWMKRRNSSDWEYDQL